MEIIPKDTRYVPLTQQKWCCVSTCIQMVMLKHNIPLVSAELMAYYFGLLVPKKDVEYFWNAKTGPKPLAGYGTQLNEDTAANKLFRKMRIPLKMKWHLIDRFEDIGQFNSYLKEAKRKDKDILVCYDWGTLFNKTYHGGHVCVLDKIYLNKNEVRIIDPEYKAPKWRVVKINKLFQAMKYHGKDKSAGFWELTATNK